MFFKFLALLFLLIPCWGSVAYAGPQKALKRGFVWNDSGEKCWYNQTFKDGVIYFTKNNSQNIGIIKFEDSDCMKDSGLGLDENKMMINNLISKWYSHSDARFKTHATDLYPTSAMQIKGYCMQSTTYPMVGVLIDYEIKNNSIVKVVHSSSVGECLDG